MEPLVLNAYKCSVWERVKKVAITLKISSSKSCVLNMGQERASAIWANKGVYRLWSSYLGVMGRLLYPASADCAIVYIYNELLKELS